MMITIHGFPSKTKYQDVKMLIKQECSINDFILDNLVNDTDGTKKVRIGLTDNTEGYKVMKCLDGYRMPGNFVLKAIPIGKAVSSLPPQPSGFDSRPSYQSQPRNDYSNAPRNDYMSQPANDYNNQGPHGTGPPHTHGGIHGSVSTHGSVGSHGSRPSQGGPHVSGGPQGSIDSMNRPSPWVSGGGNSSQWNTTMATQVPQNTFGFTSPSANVNPSYGQQPVHPRPSFNQGRAEQGYGYTPKSNIPEVVPPVRPVETRHALRSIETVDTSITHPPVHNRYPASQPYQQDKPLTIMKDNFQGPTQYNITNPGGHAGSHTGPGGHQSQYPSTAPVPWQSQNQPPKAPFSKPSSTVYDKQYDDRKYSQPDARDPKALPIRPETQDRTYKDYEKRRGFSPRRSPNGRRISPEPGRRISPTGRRVSPTGRRVSPTGRRVSPTGRRDSPTGRRISPPARRISPHARKFSPPGKRVSPDRRLPAHLPAPHHPARRESPHKRASPVRRLASPPRREELSRRAEPGRRDDPQRMARYSPDRHPEKLDKYGQDKLKQVRPAYEPTAHASNQAMYSGGYRPGGRDPVQYPVQVLRQAEPRMSPWQRERDEPPAPMKKQDDDRRDLARLQMRDRMPEAAVEAKHTLTPQRKSRSPIRRDRSPLRDRYKRHSPSPRSSHSPRRSWALEKRRSPEIRDAPPPPSWPGQNVRETDYPRTNRPNFPERDQADKTKLHVPVWETRPFEKGEEPRVRRPDNAERRPFIEDKIRPVKEIPVREPVAHPVHTERFVQREPKFTPREDYDAERRDNYRRRETSVERKPHPQREDYDPARRPREHEERPHPDEYHRRREPSPRHDSRKEEPANPPIDKDFEDIYKRALLFKKKAEELRRLESKRRDDYLEDERSRSHHNEREREERPQRYEERHRFQEDELRAREREDRPHDDRPRDDRSRDDRPRDDGPRRADYRRDDYAKERDRIDDKPKRFTVNPSIRIKRDKAIDEICNKIVDRHENYRQLKGEQRLRVLEELKLAIARIVFDMFGDTDVSFIEIIIKYQAKYNLKDEEKILQEVMTSLPSQFRTIKRQAPELSEVPAKTHRSQSPTIQSGHPPRPKLSESKRKPALSPKKQRPQQSLKRRAEAPKPEQKVIASEPKVAKGPVRISGGPESSSGSSRKRMLTQAEHTAEPKKQEEERKPVPPLPAPVEPPLQGGNYELNARMTRMVETELRDIMIKVWHELPDNPSDEAEALVVDKLRNQAGDDLRNVLGLNITKRLLNVHNPLYVKVQFSGKPEKVHLGEFLKKYNFTAFKRIEKTVNMFAAQVKTINDFDRICSAKDIRCGEIKVTVSPIYKFTKCPPNLVTSFNDLEDDASDEAAESNDKEEKFEEKTENIIISPEKVIVKTENVPTKPKVEDTKIENTTKADKVVSKPAENKTVVNKPAAENKTAAGSKPAVANKVAVKPVVNKIVVNKPAAENKTVVVSKPAVVNKVAVKPVVNKIVVNKPAAENKTAAVSKPAVANKVAVKPVVNKIVVNKPAAENKTVVVSKPAAVNKVAVKPVVNKIVVNKPAAENKTVAESKPAVVNKAAVKPVKIKTTPSKPLVENKTAANKPAVENKTTVNKTPVKPAVDKPAVSRPTPDTPVSKPAVQNKSVTKPAMDNKTVANKTVVNKPSVVNKPVVANKPAVATKTVAKWMEVKKPAATPVKTLVKATADANSTKTNKVDDYDELDDHDILALMSEGIVLDECSGSDEE